MNWLLWCHSIFSFYLYIYFFTFPNRTNVISAWLRSDDRTSPKGSLDDLITFLFLAFTLNISRYWSMFIPCDFIICEMTHGMNIDQYLDMFSVNARNRNASIRVSSCIGQWHSIAIQILLTSFKHLLKKPGCVHLHHLIWSSTTACNDLDNVYRNLCHRLRYLVLHYWNCVQSQDGPNHFKSHFSDCIFYILIYREHVSFFFFFFSFYVFTDKTTSEMTENRIREGYVTY